MEDKFILSCAINLFIIVCAMIIILINIYYITPNNYKILENNIKNNNINIIKKEIVTINPNNNLEIDCKVTKFYKFNKDVNLIISNWFKSQNVFLKKSNILETKFNSKITIQNSKPLKPLKQPKQPKQPKAPKQPKQPKQPKPPKPFDLEINYCKI